MGKLSIWRGSRSRNQSWCDAVSTPVKRRASRGKRQLKLTRAIPGTFENLEGRQMLSLLGVAPGYPELFFDTTGKINYTYNATTQQGDFIATATPHTITFSSGGPTSVFNNGTLGRGFTINFLVTNTGSVVAGQTGPNLVITGQLLDPNTNTIDNGVLLEGTISQFGYQYTGSTTNFFDFRFTTYAPNPGLLAPYFTGQDIGISLLSQANTFTGDFTKNFVGGAPLGAGADGNLGPIPPLITTSPTGSLSGFVFEDLDNNGVLNNTDVPLNNVQVILDGTDVNGTVVHAVTNTGTNGGYEFDNLIAGTYKITENQATVPSPLLEGIDSIGTLGGDASVQDIESNIVLPAGQNGVQYDFAEIPPSQISGYVYYDANNSGIFDAGDSGIGAATVTLTGTDFRGNSVNETFSTLTSPDGFGNGVGYYDFTGLLPSQPGTNYTLTETRPAGYDNGTDNFGIGWMNLTQSQNVLNETISFPQPANGTVGIQYNFGNILNFISTLQVPANATVGTPISDQATVTGGDSPTGTVTFNLYSNPNGTGTPLFTDANETLTNGVATSTGYITTATGTDYWVATYNGDANNIAVTSGTADEPVTITPATPAINTTQEPASATVGTLIADQATVTGGDSPTGTVTFYLYDNAAATGTPLFTDANVALVNGVATSTGYTATATGTDYWVATYNGDSNNSAVTSGTADEPVSITPAAPAINTTQEPATATVGTSIADQATVTGGDSPTGTVTFYLYDNAAASGTPLFTDANVALVNGVATSTGYTATATGTDYWVATYNGDSNNSAVTSGTADEPVSITPATPAINTTQEPASATVGTSIADQATVTGGDSPTGTVTFNLYDNAAATGTPLFTDANVALVNGVATSTGYTATATGTDYWVATYNGDSNNSPATSGTADEPVSITPATPAINTQQQPASATVGTSIADQATVTGGDSPTGTVTFYLYDNAAASGTPLFTDANVALVNGVATSTGYTATATGTDYWVATYNGDSNNSPATSGTADEPVSITPANPAINTQQQPASATVGTSIADKATVTGGDSPTGTVTFNLYSNPNGTGTPLFTAANVALVNGVATSPGYTATATGTDYWVATYNGDSNNSAVTSGTALEPVSITPATPAINTQQQPASATVGTSIADKATVTGGDSPTGTVTFNLYSNPNGTGTPLFTDANVALVNGVATSTGYTATATGTDYWVATYNGDSNNSSVTSGTADEPVSVTPATPAINTQQQPATATVGTSIADKATVTGGDSPTGTVTFNLYSNPNGTGTPLFTAANVALVNGVATSPGYTATATGTDYWVATYNGDSNNSAVTSGTALEPVSITPATPAINTQQQPATATVGSSIADKATVTGGDSPTGTVTFKLYSNPNGTGTPLFTAANVALVNGVATSPGYTATATGTDYWVATYNGDSNNSAVTSGTALEPVSITPATPAINTQQQPATATVGSSIADKATVTGGDSPTGTVTFKLYSNPNGTGTPLFTAANVALVNGVATSPGYTATATGTDYWVATYNGDSNNSAVTSGTALEPVSITPATPAINTQQQPATATVGSSIADKATVTGGDSPTGNVTFKLYSNPNGTGTPLFTAANVALVNGVATSPGYTATATGTDYWVATYNGDSNNSAVTSGTALEPVSITPATPAINTQQQPATATVGSSIADKATVTGGDSPTGSVTFKLYSNPNGTGTPLFTAANVALVNGVATSPGYTATATGTDYWVATYNGDANNSAITSGTALEPVCINPAGPAISTTPGGTVVLGSGNKLTDSATLSGGVNETGTITFTLYSPGNIVVDTETAIVSGNGTYHTPSGFLPTVSTGAGTYQWAVAYSGDSNNNSVSSPKGAEPEVVTASGPSITTCPGGTIVLGCGSKLTDSATLSGGMGETGTITFTLYSPGNVVVDTETVTVHGNGTYNTPSGFLPTATTGAGTYQWAVTYGGDANNSSVSSPKGAEPECVVAASPAMCTTPGGTVTIGSGAKLTDSATISGGVSETGTITFTLYSPSNAVVDTETVNVSGNGTYNTPTGFLPTTATGSGTYQWAVAYSGDSNNSAVLSPKGAEPECVNAQTDGLSGTVYYDITGNGLSADDTPMSGVVVNLYKDLNGNGVLDSTDGAPVATVTVGANGFFQFNNLAFGKYLVSETVPSGYVQTAPNLPNYYAATLSNGTFITHEDFDNFHTPICPLNNVYYTIAGQSGTLTDLRGHTLQGETVTVHFTVPTTSAPMVYTLVSYNAPSAIWDATVAPQQTIYQMDSETLGPGTHTETVTIPNNFYQIDFVCGAAIDHLGAAGSNITYSSEGRLDSADNGGTCAAASISGTVYIDYNNNGKCSGSSDVGLAGVTVQLLSGNNVLETTTTDSNGNYTFSAISAGTYTVFIAQSQNALNGLNPGKDTVGTVNNVTDGSASAVDTLSGILLATGKAGVGYNFGQVPPGQTLGCGDCGSIAFWCSTSGQNLLKCLNGNSNCTNLGTWLCSNYGNLFGSNCGSSNCSGKTNSQVCTIVTNLCNATDSNSKCKAQAICAAINCYVTNSTLCGTVACSYGFDACAGGCGGNSFNLSCFGSAFGKSNNTCQTLSQLLQYCNSQSSAGTCYGSSSTNQANACSVFTACNQAGNIGACV